MIYVSQKKRFSCVAKKSKKIPSLRKQVHVLGFHTKLGDFKKKVIYNRKMRTARNKIILVHTYKIAEKSETCRLLQSMYSSTSYLFLEFRVFHTHENFRVQHTLKRHF